MNQTDKNIAENLRRIRKARNLSLDMLAEQTGVSKSMLGQIERGESNPTVATIGKIVEGLRLTFEELLYQKPENSVFFEDPNRLPVYKEREGEYCIRTQLPFDHQRNFEIYHALIQENCAYEAASHGEGTWEMITVLEGELSLKWEDQIFDLQTGQSLRFRSDRDHKYQNKSSGIVRFLIVLSHENG